MESLPGWVRPNPPPCGVSDLGEASHFRFFPVLLQIFCCHLLWTRQYKGSVPAQYFCWIKPRGIEASCLPGELWKISLNSLWLWNWGLCQVWMNKREEAIVLPQSVTKRLFSKCWVNKWKGPNDPKVALQAWEKDNPVRGIYYIWKDGLTKHFYFEVYGFLPFIGFCLS